MGLNLLTQVVMIRALSQEAFGAFAYGLSLVATARILVTLGHGRTITRFLAIYDERRDRGRLFGTLVMESALAVGLGVLLLTAIVVFHDGLSGSIIDEGAAVGVLAIVIVLAPLEALDDLFEGLCAVLGRPGAIFVRKHVVAPLLRLAVVTALAISGAGVYFLAGGYVVALVVGLALYAFTLTRVLREHGLLAGLRWNELEFPFREITVFAVPLLSTELVYICLGTVSVAVLGWRAGTTEVALFRAILPAAELNLFVRRVFLLLFLPQVSRLHERGDRDGLARAYWVTASWMAILTFPVLAMTGPFAEPFTRTLFGDRYAESATYLAILATALYVNAAMGFNAEVLQVTARLRYLLVVNLVCAAVDVGLLLALVDEHGALGVAVANAVTIVLQNVLNQLGLRRAAGIPFASGLVGAPWLLAAGACGLLWGVELLFDPPIVAAAVVAGATSLVLLWLARHLLDVQGTFPELARVPVVGRLLVSG